MLGLAATRQLEMDKLQSRLASKENELTAALAEQDSNKRNHAMERAQLKKCEADLRLALASAAQAERARDDLRCEKDRLSRLHSQLAGELSLLRIKLGHTSMARVTDVASSLSTSSNSNASPSRRVLHASALGFEGEIPSFREISPASAYHASSIGSHVGAEDLSHQSASPLRDGDSTHGHRQDDVLEQIRRLVQQERRVEEKAQRRSGGLSTSGVKREGMLREETVGEARSERLLADGEETLLAAGSKVL